MSGAARVPQIESPGEDSGFVRWMKFTFVGGLGIGVQFAALFLLKGILHLHYLVATVLAVELAVIHNFVWHEQFTWADRTKPDGAQRPLISGAEQSAEKLDFGWRSAFSAAMKYLFSRRASAPEVATVSFSANSEVQSAWSARFAALKHCATRLPGRASLARLGRFNLANGAVSILGNVSLMTVLVDWGHLHYLVANVIAIALCSVANFLVSDTWVFER